MNQNERFAWYRQKIAEAENNGNYKRVVRYVCDALKEGGWDSVQKWTFYYDSITACVVYDEEMSYEEACSHLMWLKHMACSLDRKSQAEIIYPYMDILYLILSLQLSDRDAVAEYEDVAVELWKLADVMEPEPEDGVDLFSFASLAMASVYDRKGQTALKEAQLLHIWRRVPGMGARTDITLSRYAVDGLIALEETYEQMGRLDEAVQLTFFLLGFLLDGTLAAGWYDVEEMEDVAQKWAQQLMLRMVSFGSRVGADIQIHMMECLLFRHNFVRYTGPDDLMWIVYPYYLALMDRKCRTVPHDRLKEIERVMQEISENQLYMELTNNLLYTYYIGCYFTAKALGYSNFMDWLDQAAFILMDEQTPEPERMTYLNSMNTVMYEYRAHGQEDKAAACAYNIMDKLAHFYSLAEWSRDNREMEQYLHCCYGGFMTAYYVLRIKAESRQRLEYSMNYKNILCAVLRARNKYADLAGREKHADELKYYTYLELTRRLPEGAAVIDFLYVYRDLWRDGAIKHEERLEYSSLEIIMLVNDGGDHILCHRIEDAMGLQGRIHNFLRRIKRPDANYKKAAKALYKDILEPFADSLAGVRRLWVSPDLDLCNIPFDVLMDVSGIAAADLEITYLQSVRDIFSIHNFSIHNFSIHNFSAHKPDGECDVSCAIGNPVFGTGDGPDGRTPGTKGRPSPLPYSGYEARKVSQILKGRCFIQADAVKYQIRHGYRYLHIATHGMQTECADNPWYGSALLFSKCPDSGEADRQLYDDGILTAEEISRMDLSGTELVVLSACHSGSSVFSMFEQQTGLHAAFGAAGAGYVVSALWEADDLAAAVFMFYFYTEIAKGCSVPESLRHARQELRKTTAGGVLRMLEQDWELLGAEADGLKRELKQIPEGYALYRSPYYWANFVCYRY